MALPAFRELFSEPRLKPLAAAALAASLAGCTTQKTLTVTTEPPGAHVRVSVVEYGLASPQPPFFAAKGLVAQGEGTSPFTYAFDGESSAAPFVKVLGMIAA
ncbi:MAG TPA: hypothetical protein VJB16_02860, partial [archaeon]|nr:hypothetical protein [archaeon]